MVGGRGGDGRGGGGGEHGSRGVAAWEELVTKDIRAGNGARFARCEAIKFCTREECLGSTTPSVFDFSLGR